MLQLSEQITDLLERVRKRIRGYVWMEGIAIATIWMALTFWIGLAIDYFPVRMGANETPVAARAVLLAIIAIALAFIFYRWVLRRIFVQLHDRSIAILIERRFPEFKDSLVTSVELSQSIGPNASGGEFPSGDDEQLHQQMLRSAHEMALHHVDAVDEKAVFDFWPLRRAISLASALLASIVLFAIVAWPAFALWTSRLYGLSERPYPRQAYFEMVGFEGGQATVARGADLSIRVQADADRPSPPPNVCTIYYRTEDGERGRVNMSKKGLPRDGFQQYTFVGRPFKGILNNIRFDVVGNDYRVRDQKVRVVDSPQVISVAIDCERPAYTRLDRITLEYYPGIKVPQGSLLSVRLTTNKPIVQADLSTAGEEPPLPLEPDSNDPTSMTFQIDSLEEDLSREIVLHDVDGVTSQRPYRIAIVAVPDFAPTVQIRMMGIGSAITPDARVPMSGDVQDDYGVDKSWFEVQLSNDQTREFELGSGSSRDMTMALDFREQRAKNENPMTLAVDSSIVLSVKASDEYDLAESANVGQSDRYELEIVSANQLIALLEARELGLRRRFEQIILELRETRDSLHRVQFTDSTDTATMETTSRPDADPDADPDSEKDSEPDADSAADNERDSGATRDELAQRTASMRLLRVQRAEQDSLRSAQEVLGVALSFDDIALELVNNRVDANDRIESIGRDISEPLKETVDASYPELDASLVHLHELLKNQGTEDVVGAATRMAVGEVDGILVELESVLEKMLDLETYNELVDLIRSMIKDQEDLAERTKNQRKKSALDLLK